MPNPTNNNEERCNAEIDFFIQKWCGDNAPHLLDTDNNDGQRLREVIAAQIQAAEKRGKREGLEEAKELLSDHYFDSLQHEKGMILFHTDAVIDQALKKLNQ